MVELTIAASWVKHVRCEENARNLDNVVGSATHTSCQWPETDSGRLSDDDPGGWSRTQSEEDRDDQAERSLCVLRCLGESVHGACDTKCDKEDRVDCRTPQVDRSSAEVRSENPGNHDEDHLQSRCDESQCESSVGANASLSEEVDSLVGDEVTSQVLCGVHTTNDEGSSEICSLEKFDVAGLLLALLQLNGSTHHGNGLV